MKFSRMLALLFVLILAGCTKSNVPEIQDDIQIQYTNANDKLDSITSDLILPTVVNKINITWESDSAFAIIEANRVVINRQDSDIQVTLTASFELGDKTYTKDFEITIIKSTFDFNSLFNALYIPSETSTSFTLPVSINSHDIDWASSHEAIISVLGVVTPGSVDQVVTLTATIKADGALRSHTYQVTVLAKETFDLNAFRTFLNVPSSTEVDLVLPSTYEGLAIAWISSLPNVLSNTGLITRQFVDTTVELRASVTFENQVYEVEFDVIVVKEEVITPDYQAILNQISLPAQTSSNLTLPNQIDDVEIEWSSNHVAISHTGVVTRQSTDVTVTLTAVIKDNTTFTKSFNVVVQKLPDLPVSNEMPIAEVRLKAQGSIVRVQGVITSLMTNGNFTIQDSTGAIPVYMNNNTGLKVGTEYIIEGTLGIFQGLIQISTPTIIQTKGEKPLPEGIDLTGYSFNFDDVMLYEANIITYRDLEVTSKTTPNNAIELYLKNIAGETTVVRLDTRVNTSPYPFTTIEVGDIVDLFNVTVGQYQAKAQLLFSSRSSIVSRPKNPEIININGAVNKNYIIGDALPNYLEGITAKNGYGDDFTSLLGYDAPNVDLNTPGDYEITVYVNNHPNVFITYTLFVRNEIETGVYEGYYASLNGLTGSSFNNALKALIVNTGRATGSTSEVQSVDRVGNSYYLIYDGMGSYGNREHVWPDSKLGSVKYDLHNLRAANTGTNSSRSNFPFVEDGKTFTGSQPYMLINKNSWYPGDEHIGDVARIVLYISIRYNLNIDVVGNLQTFLQWHELDPVNEFEQIRNDRIYGIQNNRNPFIDHPELVNIYFGSGAQKLPVSIALVTTSVHMLADYRRYQY